MTAFKLLLSQLYRMFSPITKHQVSGQCPASGKTFRTETSGFISFGLFELLKHKIQRLKLVVGSTIAHGSRADETR